MPLATVVSGKASTPCARSQAAASSPLQPRCNTASLHSRCTSRQVVQAAHSFDRFGLVRIKGERICTESGLRSVFSRNHLVWHGSGCYQESLLHHAGCVWSPSHVKWHTQRQGAHIWFCTAIARQQPLETACGLSAPRRSRQRRRRVRRRQTS